MALEIPVTSKIQEPLGDLSPKPHVIGEPQFLADHFSWPD